MNKRITSLLLVFIMLAFSSVAIYAEQSVQVKYLNRDIVVNGESIKNYQADAPYFMYNEIVYVPLTDENCKIFGIDKIAKEDEVLLSKTAPSQRNYAQRWQKTNSPQFYANISDAKISRGSATGRATNAESIKEYTNGYPVLESYGHVYIPLTSGVLNDFMDWDYFYDKYSGVYLSTTKEQSAESMLNTANSVQNKKMSEYITSVNKNYNEASALDLVFMVEEESDVYKVDPLMIMAMIQKESTFNPRATSGSGARGLMQIMPATGKQFGVSAAQLYDPNTNIEVGIQYISQGITNYGGDSVKALSAYNQGSGAVSRGSYNRGYYNGVMKHYDNISSNVK